MPKAKRFTPNQALLIAAQYFAVEVNNEIEQLIATSESPTNSARIRLIYSLNKYTMDLLKQIMPIKLEELNHEETPNI